MVPGRLPSSRVLNTHGLAASGTGVAGGCADDLDGDFWED
jgi:hypothetical protein